MNINKYLKFFAHFVKSLNLPHELKYLFFLLLRNRRIKVRSPIKFSDAKMDLNLGEFIGYWIFMDGSYEEEWITEIAKMIKGEVFIDIGANIGVYSLSLFKLAKKIYAFEPEAENYKILINNLEINRIKNAQAYKIAISNRNTNKLPLFVNKGNRGLSSLKIPYTEGKQMVGSITLDSFVKKNMITDIGLIKIDVEGSELDVLIGAPYTLNEIGPPILIELNGRILKLSNQTPVNLYETLIKYKYRAYQLQDTSLIPFSKSELTPTMNCNILFIK